MPSVSAITFPIPLSLTTLHSQTICAKVASGSIRNLMRFFELDKVICWDLTWGMWEATRQGEDEFGWPCVTINGTACSLVAAGEDAQLEWSDKFNALAAPITSQSLREALLESTGYYLQGGSTYTMSLFHNMWHRQPDGGHKLLLRELVKKGLLFYMGHSAGSIMSGPNIVTTTWKCIDAFSHCVQPFNAQWVRLPPSESNAGLAGSTFFVPLEMKNNLYAGRTHMLAKMQQYGGWEGFGLVDVLTFPHYDARPVLASFPQSAATYLDNTDEHARFSQHTPSFEVPPPPAGTSTAMPLSSALSLPATSTAHLLSCTLSLPATGKGTGCEPEDVKQLRLHMNRDALRVLPIANGHSVVLEAAIAREHVLIQEHLTLETFSPEEEGQDGPLHFDTYMPVVEDVSYTEYRAGRVKFAAGSLSATGVAGDRAVDGCYKGGRIVSRLQSFGLPTPAIDEVGLWRKPHINNNSP